jgi:O-antigen/teichoic acid export membrane protein
MRGTLGSGGLKVANRALALILSLMLARLFGTESYGTYASLMAALTLLAVLASLGMPTLLLREVAAWAPWVPGGLWPGYCAGAQQ